MKPADGASHRPRVGVRRAPEGGDEQQEQYAVGHADDAHRERLAGEILERHRDAEQEEERHALEAADPD